MVKINPIFGTGNKSMCLPSRQGGDQSTYATFAKMYESRTTQNTASQAKRSKVKLVATNIYIDTKKSGGCAYSLSCLEKEIDNIVRERIEASGFLCLRLLESDPFNFWFKLLDRSGFPSCSVLASVEL
ncbi:hypothetical protein K2173_028001 [Erythroxylum novogranatense]|uniref:Uncharacterized protein n=1 Tax=Erythroxylum novogranatense TaxID=1862640 RepID=A0AAV8U3L6_9ROSI|nr:hypothetical protein K2173_028001 [Erythroxylum novogranatense]